jgi:hypothetical protein
VRKDAFFASGRVCTHATQTRLSSSYSFAAMFMHARE